MCCFSSFFICFPKSLKYILLMFYVFHGYSFYIIYTTILKSKTEVHKLYNILTKQKIVICSIFHDCPCFNKIHKKMCIK